MENFNEMDTLLKVFWYLAIPSSLIFLIQTIMTFIGADATDGLEADFDSNLEGAEGPFQFFSFRNLIHFLLGFGWTGISFYGIIENKTLLIGVSLIVGIGFVAMFFFIISQIRKLAEDNTFKIKETLGKTGEVYLTIPERKSGIGKVQISIKGSFRELRAITEFESLKSGTLVKIKSIDSDNILIVEKL
ncbi:serine protease [Aquiflexum sp. LQ15W]|uniref:serine protease n=1 Tax=Cognataquiflexum nitidum TaxID=2922272 RepID=UPI001F141A4B|nr:serine protease [Cognataquiflexum nitidum]MCH6198928.1 serine protease [Cognataquiflexum nitidum]